MFRGSPLELLESYGVESRNRTRRDRTPEVTLGTEGKEPTHKEVVGPDGTGSDLEVTSSGDGLRGL